MSEEKIDIMLEAQIKYTEKLWKEKEELQQRIQEAIEYIKENLSKDDNGCGVWWYSFEYYTEAKKELLEMLGDKE